MNPAYDAPVAPSRHPVGDEALVAVAVSVVLGVWLGFAAVVVWAVAVGLVVRPRFIGALCLLLGLAGTWSAGRAWSSVHPQHLGPYQGWTRVVADPAAFGSGLRVTVEVQGQRFDVWSYGASRSKLAEVQAGEYVWMAGERRSSTGDLRRAQVRHVVGRLQLDAVGDVLPGNGLSVAGNRVRTALRRSAERTMGLSEAALFTGLVIGDDSRQPQWMIDRFRASGLSHLTAVSGQNLAYLIAAALPLLRRLRPWWRWAATVGLIGWFMSVTRFEPSVLRAGAMAVLAATAFVLGRQPRPLRLVAIAVAALVLVDPLLVWSVGFWLSVGATVGVCVAAPWWVAHLPGPVWLRLPLGVTLGAQTGVAIPSLLVFHRLPVVSVVANLAAVPVAGFVMLYGLPAGLVAAWSPEPLTRLIMAPATLGTRWTATVADVAAAVEPTGAASVVGWSLVLGVLVAMVVRGGSRAARSGVPF